MRTSLRRKSLRQWRGGAPRASPTAPAPGRREGGAPSHSSRRRYTWAAARSTWWPSRRERRRIREAHLRPAGERPASSARGLHHTALVSSDVERTVRFYQDLLGFPLTELIENRDYPGSSHFFFDIGNSNLLAFFDFPGLDVGPYAEVLGGLHHLAISVEPSRWEAIVARLDEAGVEHVVHSEVSVYFTDPDGARIELIADPLGEMYGTVVL